ncbi:MAG: AAA family ATPase [Bryobacterales bacterium]|nr:AAA family ATPase [Bryobacterales bacterium]
MPPVDQAAVIAWLSTPSPYGAATQSVERIDTHTSVVFLVGDTAFKLKRAVRFDYLDYSTLERRRHCCIEEVRLNCRTAPQLYRRVRAVCQAPSGALALDGWDHAVDYLVEMKRFDTDAQLDRLAERGALEAALMPRLADAIAHLHGVAEPSLQHGGRDGMAAVLRGLRDGMCEHGPGVLDQEVVERVSSASFRTLYRQAELLDGRRAAGFVRHGHGGLHLRNICLLGGQPVLFDCIEFNSAIACVDVMYDVAFLLMDLLHRGLETHANAVLNRYLDRQGDIGGLTLLPLFLATRAAIRAMTQATAVAMQRGAAEAAALRVEAQRYLDLAQELIAPPAPRLVAVGGPSGSGKTTLARRLAASVGPPPGALVLRSDVERKRLLGVPEEMRLGPDGYQQRVTQDVYRNLAERAEAVLKTGHGVIVDAVFGDPVDQAAMRDVSRANGVQFDGLWLTTPLDTLQARINARVGDASDATADVVARQIQQMRPPESWTVLNGAGDAATVWRAARHFIESPEGVL